MPFYFGEDSPGWDEYMQRLEAENLARGPLDRFTYVEPWEAKASVAFKWQQALQGSDP